MADSFGLLGDSVSSPARRAVAVVPHDSNRLSDAPKALYVGTGGNIILQAVDDDADILWKNVPAGAVLPVRAELIKATGTTAGDILALY
jgi:hypothetical protein